MQGFEFLAKGKRSSVFVGTQKNKQVAVKIFDKHIDRSFNEAYWLKRLNKVGIGPKLISYHKNKVMYEFVDGIPIKEFLLKDDDPKDVIIQSLIQCRKLDLEQVAKEELQHPDKHILITEKRKVFMIDFEKCHSTKNPKNVTQFGQFIMSPKVRKALKKSGIKINKKEFIQLLKNYKADQSPENFKKIRLYLKKKKKLSS